VIGQPHHLYRENRQMRASAGHGVFQQAFVLSLQLEQIRSDDSDQKPTNRLIFSPCFVSSSASLAGGVVDVVGLAFVGTVYQQECVEVL